jgi:hypothetical protein
MPASNNSALAAIGGIGVTPRCIEALLPIKQELHFNVKRLQSGTLEVLEMNPNCSLPTVINSCS